MKYLGLELQVINGASKATKDDLNRYKQDREQRGQSEGMYSLLRKEEKNRYKVLGEDERGEAKMAKINEELITAPKLLDTCWSQMRLTII